MAGTYKTTGRERLLRFLSAHPDTPYTVDELTDALRQAVPAEKEIPHIVKSSLYRQLAELVDDGTVRRDMGDAARPAAAVYRYIGRSDCARHFHLQCVTCGCLLHLDCTLTDDLLSHIQTDHHFLINMSKSILYGECESCRKSGGSRENEGNEGNEGECLRDFFLKKSLKNP